MKSETKFVNKISPLLRNVPDSVWFNISQRSVKGTPDILGCVAGTFVALEIKKEEKEVRKRDNRTKLQDYNLRRIRHAGGYGRFCYPENWGDVLRDLNRLAMGTLNLDL